MAAGTAATLLSLDIVTALTQLSPEEISRAVDTAAALHSLDTAVPSPQETGRAVNIVAVLGLETVTIPPGLQITGETSRAADTVAVLLNSGTVTSPIT